MTEQFKGKKIFLLGSAPDPKIDYEKVKDHVWITMKGSGWAIENCWGIDRIPDYLFMTGHHLTVFNDEMWPKLHAKTLVHLIATNSLRGLMDPDKKEILLDDDTHEGMYEFYKEKGVKFDDLFMLSIIDAAEGMRQLVESNFFIKTRRYLKENLSLGVGTLCYILLSGAEEVVISGISIDKGLHSYSGRDLTSGQLLGLHLGEDMIALTLLKKFGWNVKTFEPELNRVCGIPMK